MKNILKSKAFPTAALSVACIGVLAISLFIGRDDNGGFQPEEPALAASLQEWKEPYAAPEKQPEPSTPANDSHPSAAYTPSKPTASEDSLEAYPKVVEETGQLVTIDFTPDPKELQPEPPEAPVAEGDPEDPGQPPAYTLEELEQAPDTVPAKPDTPAAGSSNGNGAVYDPVFGWVVPGQVNQTPMDSAGDPDKMVGNM